MPIQRICVRNYKSFAEIDILLNRFNVVIGSNAAGKSNFISVFRFLRDISRHGLDNAIAMQGGAEYIRNAQIGEKRDLEISVWFTPENGATTHGVPPGRIGPVCVRPTGSVYHLALRFDKEGDGYSIAKDQMVTSWVATWYGEGSSDNSREIHGEIRVIHEGGEVKFDAVVPEGCPFPGEELIPPFSHGRLLAETNLLLETSYAIPLPAMDRFFDRIAVYDIDPKLPKQGVVVTGKRNLEEDGRNLALVVKSIVGDPDKRRKFTNLLRDILPFIEDFSVRKFMDISVILTMREKYAKSRDLPASSLSDGTITIFALIIALYFEDRPFMVIEEPTSHIHPFLVSRVIAIMKEAAEKNQVLITTHSTEVVKHARIDDILLISRDSGGFSIISRPADAAEVKTFLENEIGIEDLYVQNLLGI
jgi:predicted ATPase